MFAFNLPTFSRASRTAVNAAKNSARVALKKTSAPTASKVQLRGVITVSWRFRDQPFPI
jgi:hypothetical protein